jgi:hypothetical protein
MDSAFSYEASRDQNVWSGHENPWAIRNPLDEARDLYRMVRYGSCTVGSIRDLISVPPEIEASLLAYADRYPKDGQRIHCVLQFRRKVSTEFERLLDGDMSCAANQFPKADDDTAPEIESEMEAVGAEEP